MHHGQSTDGQYHAFWNVHFHGKSAGGSGNSGGALFNMNGELVGINTAKVSSTDVEGMGYAIPISQVLELIESMMNGYQV